MNIIVPINVAALRVSPSTNEQAKTALYDFSLLGLSPVSAQGELIAANRFQQAQVSLGQEPGIHLHWSLPREYTHGRQDQRTGHVSFPVMPNRWLVVRFLQDQQLPDGENTSVRAWVLESDAHGGRPFTDQYTPSLIPWMDDPADVQGLQFNYAGRKTDLAGSWQEPDPAQPGFLGTSFQAPFGYGETFTAYYRNSQTVLGLYDDLADHYANPNQLEVDCRFSASYSVVGWVNAPALDQCNQVLRATLARYQELPEPRPEFATYLQSSVEQELGWSLTDYSALTPAAAEQCQAVMSGVVAAISWDIKSPGNPSYPDALPAGTGVAVSAGNNTAEALSAYLNARQAFRGPAAGDVASNVEMLLNALQFGQLQKLPSGDVGVGQLEEFLHGTGFASEEGGYQWLVRRQPTPGQAPASATDTEAPLPLYLARVLSELNHAQLGLDTARGQVNSRRQQSFLDWSYHIKSLDDNVVNGSGDLGSDLSGPFLTDGLMRLYELLLLAGNYQSAALPTAPYQPVPDAFSIRAPFAAGAGLAAYAFNQAANEVAGRFIHDSLALGARLDRVGEEQLPAAQQGLGLVRALLLRYQPGTSDGPDYLSQAAAIAGTVAEVLQGVSQLLADLRADQTGLPALRTGIALAADSLRGQTGVFDAALAYTSTQAVPLPASPTHSNAGPHPTYTGGIKQATLKSLQSWDAPVGNFPGIKAQLDVWAGQGGQPKNLFETEHAALYLGMACFYYQSGEAPVRVCAYYLQMAHQELLDAQLQATAGTASLQAATTALAGPALTALADALAQLSTTILPAVQAAIAAATPERVAAAAAQLGALLDDQQPVSLPALRAAARSADWQTLRAGLDAARTAVARRLPWAQRVAQHNQFLGTQLAAGYLLEATPADAFFSPNDPVLLFAEQSENSRLLKPVNRNGLADRLPCRLETELLSATPAGPVPPLLSGLAASLSLGIAGLSATLQKLGLEGYLLAPEFAAVVPAAGLQAAAGQNAAAQRTMPHNVGLGAAPAGLAGRLPYYIAYSWFAGHDDFLPLFIWWETDYQYAQNYQNDSETYPADFLSLFELGEYGVDLQPTAAGAQQFARSKAKNNFFSTHGVISLSSSTTANLCDQIATYCRSSLGYDPAAGPPVAGQPNYQQELRFYQSYTDYKTLNVLSQGLSGFGAGLVQRAQELQVPVNIPRAWTAASGHGLLLENLWPTTFLHAQTPEWPVDWNAEGRNLLAQAASADKVNFAPLRAGFLQLKSVVLVDVFGRFVSLDLSQPLTPAESLTTTATPAPADHPVYLAPRLVQPSRLSFNWLSASSPGGIGSFVELGAQPTASPICGWLFPNQLDGSLMLYNADGVPLGSLGSRGQALHWFPVPGERTEPGADNRAQMQAYFRAKSANAVFGQFLGEFLYAGDAVAARPRLLKFMQVLSLAQQFIITPAMQQSTDLALLIGQPLVLTQALLALEQKGQPSVSLDLTSYPEWNKAGWQFDLSSKAFIPYNLANLNQGNLGQLRVPVKVGTTEVRAGDSPVPYFDDGLAAYFVADDYSTLYTPVRTASSNGIVSAAYPAASPVELLPNGEPVLLTLLLDPRAAVHATTGLLPVSQVSIPGSGFAHVAEQLQVSFLTAPVLASATPPLLPVPAESGYQWFWQQVGQPDQGPLKTDQQSTSAVFPNSPQQLVDGWLKLKKNHS